MQPDRDPAIARILVDHWHKRRLAEPSLPFADERARFRHSSAASCLRAAEYRLTGVPESDPPDIAFDWSVGIGSLLHEQFQQVATLLWGDDVIVEAVAIIGDDDPADDDPGVLSAAHIDLVLKPHGRAAVELKTINGTGYKAAVGCNKAGPQGPRFSHRVQAAVNAMAAGADLAIVVYLPLESISAGVAKRAGLDDITRVCAQWTMTRDVWEPLAEWQVAQWREVAAQVDAGVRLPRFVPDEKGGKVVTNPLSGQVWNCDYCPFQTHCSTDDGQPAYVPPPDDGLDDDVFAGVFQRG